MQEHVVVTGSFDDLRSRHVRFLHEASRFGPVTVLMWPDELLLRQVGSPPKFPEHERIYLVGALRHVNRVVVLPPNFGAGSSGAAFWAELVSFAKRLVLGQVRLVVMQSENSADIVAAAHVNEVSYTVIPEDDLVGFPEIPTVSRVDEPSRKKVIVTGCFDWLHSGHVRFFEEVSALGNLYVAVGNDANVRMLKGPGHPLHPQDERRYMVASVRYVKQALITTGSGWLDAEPEILRLKPDIYAVNEDGDRGGKREFCRVHGIEYVVLKREPAPGLPPRTSTELRGF